MRYAWRLMRSRWTYRAPKACHFDFGVAGDELFASYDDTTRSSANGD